jgi:hypothetical protein
VRVAPSDLMRGRETPLILVDLVAGSVDAKYFPSALHYHLLELEAILALLHAHLNLFQGAISVGIFPF